jgi:serine/threonine-protein kinase/endoribonuclease IRE1
MPRHAAKGVLLAALLLLQPFLAATQQQLHGDHGDIFVEEDRLPYLRTDRRHKFDDAKHKHFRDTVVISSDSSALATLAPASQNDAVRAHPLRQPSKSAGLSPQLQARSLQDWEVEDFVLLATVDGRIHARNRKTGAERWALQTEDPMVETIYHRNRSDSGDPRPWDDYLWIIEPTRDGNIYLYSSQTPEGGLTKLGVTVKQLVEEHSPWSGMEPPVVYNGEKKTSLYTIDAATGEILKYFSSRPSTVEPDSCRRMDNLEDAMEKEECKSRGTLTLGRIEYTVNIQSSQTGQQICTLKYYEWAPNNRDLDLQNQYLRTMDQRHIYTLHDGRVFGYDHAQVSPRPTYARKFSSPVARVFDVARPLHSDSPDTPLIILSQPVKQPDSDIFDTQFDDRNSRIYINSTEEGGWYALSEQLYPMVTGSARKAKIYEPELFATFSQIKKASLKQQRTVLEGVHSIYGFETNQRPLQIGGHLDPGNDTPGVVDPRFPQPTQRPALPNSILLRAAREYSLDIVLALLICLVSMFVYVNRENLNRLLRKKMDVRQIVPALQQSLASAPATPIVNQAPWANELAPDKSPEREDSGKSGDTGEWTVVDGKTAAEDENRERVKIQELSHELDGEEKGDGTQPEKKKTRRGKRAGQAHRKNRKSSADNENPAKTNFDAAELVEQIDPPPTLEPDIIKVNRTLSNDTIEIEGGIQIGQLKVFTDILGHGSHGTVVYRGSFDGRDVAVKRLLKEFFDIASHEVSLLQESDDHTNVIRYYCREQASGFLYIALELCPASLQDVVEKPAKFPSLIGSGMNVPDALRQITAGVRHLHSLKIVHRDLKPQNILVAAPKPRKGVTTSGLRLLISDFGLCKKLDDNQSSFRATTAHAAGTSGFRAPELLVDDDENPTTAMTTSGETSEPAVVDPQTNRRATRAIDIFSLGCVFYYVLTNGGHPFDDGGRFMREANIVKGKHNLDDLQKLGDYAFEADDLIRQMLAMNPKER